MEYSDNFFQGLMRIRQKIPVRSTYLVEQYIQRFDLNETEINDDFLRGFEYAVTIIGEKLREERE